LSLRQQGKQSGRQLKLFVDDRRGIADDVEPFIPREQVEATLPVAAEAR